MTTLQQIELQCPICETRFRSQAVVSTNSFGGKRTDFHERAAGTQPLPYLIHMCNRCGFSGSERVGNASPWRETLNSTGGRPATRSVPPLKLGRASLRPAGRRSFRAFPERSPARSRRLRKGPS